MPTPPPFQMRRLSTIMRGDAGNPDEALALRRDGVRHRAVFAVDEIDDLERRCEIDVGGGVDVGDDAAGGGGRRLPPSAEDTGGGTRISWSGGVAARMLGMMSPSSRR